MPRSQGSGCGCGCSASMVQVANPNIPHPGESIHPFQLIPFQPNPNTIEHLASAAAMIETDGDPINTLQEHQSRRQSSQLPSQGRLRPYSIPSSCTTSRCTSRMSASIYDLDGDERPERARRSAKSEVKPTDMRYYEEPDQKNIKHACKLIVLDMLLESGWQKTSELEQVAMECISQASAVSGHVTEPMEGINKLIFDGLSTIRGKLVNEAERVLSALDIYPPDDTTMSDDEKNDYIQQRANNLLDDKHISGYTLHGYDPDRGKTLVYSAPAYLDLHEDFWFGCTSPFLDPQSRVLITHISWIMYALTGAVAHHDKCFSLPSSTFNYHPAPVTSSSSSSSSSTTSWLPCQDEHDPVVTNSPTMVPFNQYYLAPHYSSSRQHGLADPNGSPVLPYNVPSDLHGFNTSSDQYSIGGSSWGGGASGTGGWGSPMA
ncbi:hypothetical protein F4604DRAFT_1677776 [Suillus subluteus]|nr:hypothetical protein F4604DRAFT_1677776 [Suillus subluteus]